MRFWWLSDRNCSAPLRARACRGYLQSSGRSSADIPTIIAIADVQDLIERAYMERLMQQHGNVQQIRKVEM